MNYILKKYGFTPTAVVVAVATVIGVIVNSILEGTTVTENPVGAKFKLIMI